jgi:hypothetical protein
MKITKNTLKKRLRDNFYAIKVVSDFDGMTDCVQPKNVEWKQIDQTKIDFKKENTWGIN